METIAHIMFAGIVIGIFISAPMGPIGMLVIQRTLNKGRRAAFYTGIGAALSDLIYCLLTGLGLSFVTEFIESNKDVLQIIGSLMLIIYAVYLFKANPSRQLNTPRGNQPNTYWSDFGTGFIFTFSNPLILFFIISLFARFNFMDSEHIFYHYILGYMSIVAGAVGWWFLITYFVNKVRAHFNVRSLWLVNRVLAVLLLGMSLVGFVTGIKNLLAL